MERCSDKLVDDAEAIGRLLLVVQIVAHMKDQVVSWGQYSMGVWLVSMVWSATVPNATVGG